MRLSPLLASLTRHKLTVTLMVLATALTCAIVVNVAAMIVGRFVLLNAPSGLDESSLVTIDSSRVDAAGFGSDNPNYSRLAQYQEDVKGLRSIVGVRAVTTVSGLPFMGGMGIDIAAKVGATEGQMFQVTGFMGDAGEVETLGLHLLHGRDFLPSEYVPLDGLKGLQRVSAAIVSRALADRLFQTDDAEGRLFYTTGRAIRVVGVVDHLMDMNPQLGAADNEYAMLLPMRPDGDYTTFILRTKPGDRERVQQSAVDMLASRDPQRIFDAQSFAQLRAKYFRRESAMIGLLLAASLGLLIVTAAGLAGLASFWVQQRTRSIGIRRALGATRTDILCYFQTENFLIVTGGVLLGSMLAYVINLLLMKYYALQVLAPGYLAIGMLALWLIGQLAVLGPALRASAVPPVVATRSV